MQDSHFPADFVLFAKDNCVKYIFVELMHSFSLIFTTLRNQLEVGQRPLLHRIGSCDLVVLMSDGSIELKNGQPVRGSTAHLLLMALYEVRNAAVFGSEGSSYC